MKRAVVIIILLLLMINSSNISFAAVEKNNSSLSILEVIKQCLEANFDIRKMKIKVKNAERNFQKQKGDFDYTIRTYATQLHQEETLLDDKLNLVEAGLRIGKLFSNGMNISAAITNQRYDFPGSGQEAINYSSVDFSIEIPILKNAGKKSTYAYASVAELGIQSEKLRLKHQVCSSIRQTLITYWEYVASGMILDERKKAEERAQSLVEDTEELIKRKEVAPAEIVQYQGNLGSKISSRLAQEQALYEVRLNLGKLMGLTLEESENLPMPGENFPDMDSLDVKLDEKKVAGILEKGREKRSDYQALKNDEVSASILFKAAKRNTLPTLNLNLGLGYNGYNIGNNISNFWNAVNDNIPGLNFNSGFVLILPIANNSALGTFKQRYYDLKQLAVNEKELSLNIKSEIMKYYKQIIVLLRQYSFTRQSTNNYKMALENEKIKYKMNMSTQLDVITTEEKYIEAAIQEIRIKKDLAVAIINLRFSMGEFGYFDNDVFVVEKEGLITLPSTITDQ